MFESEVLCFLASTVAQLHFVEILDMIFCKS